MGSEVGGARWVEQGGWNKVGSEVGGARCMGAEQYGYDRERQEGGYVRGGCVRGGYVRGGGVKRAA